MCVWMPGSHRRLLPTPQVTSNISVNGHGPHFLFALDGFPRLLQIVRTTFCTCTCLEGSREFRVAKRRTGKDVGGEGEDASFQAIALGTQNHPSLSWWREEVGGGRQPGTIHQVARNTCPQQVPEGSAEGAVNVVLLPICTTLSSAEGGRGRERHLDEGLCGHLGLFR